MKCLFPICFYTDSFPPRAFSIQPKEGTPAEEGFTKTLICKTSSIPRPTYRWLKDDVYLSQNSTSTAWTFRILSLARNDTGVYRCEATNELGSVLSAPANLKVSCKYRKNPKFLDQKLVMLNSSP